MANSEMVAVPDGHERTLQKTRNSQLQSEIDPAWHLRDRWIQLCERIGERGAAGVALFDCLVALYGHPPRGYHNLNHVAELLEVFDGVRLLAADVDGVEFALWLHDCVYVAGRTDNEERSAAVAEAFLCARGVGAGRRGHVCGMILATRHDGPSLQADERLAADIDLSRLAVPAAAYDDNSRRIRAEFAFVSDADFAAGRRAFCESLLMRDAIFQTEHFRRTCEAGARENLKRAMGKMAE